MKYLSRNDLETIGGRVIAAYKRLPAISGQALERVDICLLYTSYHSKFSRNRILFGAPGTGKSFTLNHEKDLLLADGGEYELSLIHI